MIRRTWWTFVALVDDALLRVGWGTAAVAVLLTVSAAAPFRAEPPDGPPITWRWADDPGAPIVAGECRRYDAGLYVCVPARSPIGGTVDEAWEDGSARYSDGSVFDPSTARFRIGT